MEALYKLLLIYLYGSIWTVQVSLINLLLRLHPEVGLMNACSGMSGQVTRIPSCAVSDTNSPGTPATSLLHNQHQCCLIRRPGGHDPQPSTHYSHLKEHLALLTCPDGTDPNEYTWTTPSADRLLHD